MVEGGQPAPARTGALALATAALLHALVLFLLLWRLGASPTLAEAPTINVQLLPPLHPRAATAEKRPPAPRRGATAMTSPSHETPSPPELNADIAPSPPTAAPTAGEVRGALRGLLGCQHAALARLSTDERQRCLDQIAQVGVGERPPTHLNLDIRGEFARDPEPYLQRSPKKGCKLRAAGDVSVMGNQGAAIGFSCGRALGAR